MTDICLVVSPDPANTERWLAPECLGVGLISAHLECEGMRVRTIDGYLLRLSVDEIVDRIVRSNARVTAIQLMSPWTSDVVLRILDASRERGYKGLLGVGGNYASLDADHLIRAWSSLDFVAVGDSEAPLTALLKSNGAIHGIAGIRTRDTGSQTIGFRPPNLEGAPFVKRPFARVLAKAGIPLSLYFSRGCFRKCDFCCVVPFSELGTAPAWRRRCPVNVVDEISHLNSAYGADQFIFVDDNFVGPRESDRQAIREFCAEIRKRHLRISFAIETHPRDIQPDLIEELIEAGLTFIAIGFESGSGAQLKRLKKGSNEQVNQHACEVLARAKVPTYLNSIIFDQDSTFCEARSTLNVLNQFADVHSFNVISHAEARIGTRMQKRLYPNVAMIDNRERPSYAFSDPRISVAAHVLIQNTADLFVMTQDLWRMLWLEWRARRLCGSTESAHESPVRQLLAVKNRVTLQICNNLIVAAEQGLEGRDLQQVIDQCRSDIGLFAGEFAASMHLSAVFVSYLMRSVGHDTPFGWLSAKAPNRFDVVQRRSA